MMKNAVRMYILRNLKQQRFSYSKLLLSDSENGIIDLCQKDSIDIIYEINPNFVKIQTNIQFHEKYLDLLMFPTPCIVTDEKVEDIKLFLNYVNRIIKSFGRFYLDEYNDIAYSLRIPYDFFNNNKERMMNELIDTPISFYMDINQILVAILIDLINVEEAEKKLNEVFGY
ncbi:hypothetical protein BHU61_00415 [Macrococcus epidermidis]|uniref:Uncharacterized protein n=1 Tax=Macrococcus epidermidis TaxID=1902580 RepID=A0A327ZUH4_9STAP|nr:hypothetical protein [Macrococcus epidermidis]RAK45942.1 hypothetical protein BHU61_00415 [Macrococcus epidermidis]